MKIYAINGSPRKKWNTAVILDNVLEGAKSACPDIEARRIDLYSCNYKGCVSCFECKRIGGPSYGKCAVKDDIHDILDQVLHGDIAVFGTPIYFGNATGMIRSFWERLFFPIFVYDPGYSSLAPKKLRTAFIYTMNVTFEVMKQMKYPEALKPMEGFASHAFGHEALVQYVNYTYQFSDYSKYKNEVFPEAEKARHREMQFPIDCEKARELGRDLVAQAKSDS